MNDNYPVICSVNRQIVDRPRAETSSSHTKTLPQADFRAIRESPSR